MNRPDNLGDLEPEQWDKLQELAVRFEEACKRGAVQDLAEFLPAKENALRAVALLELLKVDLEIRWRRKDGQLLETYLQRFPELGPSSGLSPQLIFEEYRIRHLYGDKPALASYQVRFAEQFGRLQQLVRENPAQPSAPGSAASSFAITSKTNTTLHVGEGYKLIQRIGQGSFAEVWRGEAPGGVPVAIKVILRPIDHDEAKRELHSLDLIKRLRHPFLLPTYAFWLDEDRLFIVMELADCSLRERLKQCRQIGQNCLDPVELFTYILEAAQALDFLHREHVLHRDIKPENILLLERHAKVADFGLARVLQSQQIMTATGSGTPRYMGPEIWKGRVNQQSDQYALAMTYTELRLGRSPFHSRDMTGIMYDHIERMPDLGDLPQPEQQVLLRALAKETEARYPSCWTFAKELEQALSPILAPPRPASGDSETKRSSGTRLSEAPLAESEGPAGSRKAGVAVENADVYRTLVPGADPIPDDSQLSDQETPRRGDPGFPTVQLHRTLPSRSKSARRHSLSLPLVAFFLVASALAVAWYFWPSFALAEPESRDVKAGEAVSFTLHVKRDRMHDPINIVFPDLPENIVIATDIAPDKVISEASFPDDEKVDLKLSAIALPDAAPGKYQVTVRAKAGIWQNDAKLNLEVKERSYFLPPGWRKANGSPWRDVGGKIYYDKIEVVREKMEDQPVPFVFIPGDSERSINAFYIMETKVWAGLYRAFQDHYAKGLDGYSWNSKWNELKFNAIDKFPVFDVPPEDANKFAQWLVENQMTMVGTKQKGRLPRENQWDKAAGRFEDHAAESGPFIGSLASQPHPDVAVFWKMPTIQELKNKDPNSFPRPSPVGQSRDDVSVFGVRDMAGNGLEFTCIVQTNNDGDQELHKMKALGSGDVVHLRSCKFSSEKPLCFKDLDEVPPVPGSYDRSQALPPISFRVVFEP
ncbi:MAG: protein kinase domain-containing protein [Gemmataceae bacterium]